MKKSKTSKAGSIGSKATGNDGEAVSKTAANAAPSASGAKVAVRSTDNPSPPMYQPSVHGDEGPKAEALFALLGLTPMRSLTAAEIQPLLKADDQTLALISDNIVQQYQKDASTLGIKNLTPELLGALHDRMLYLQPRADTANLVAVSASHQKIVAVSDLVDALLRIRRKVNALREDEPELSARWDRLLGYFDARYPGRSATASVGVPTPALGDAPSTPSDAVGAVAEQETPPVSQAPTTSGKGRSASKKSVV